MKGGKQPFIEPKNLQDDVVELPVPLILRCIGQVQRRGRCQGGP